MRFFYVFLILFPLYVQADDISKYRYYEINRSASYLAYLKKEDPCIYAGYIKENDMHRYCEMGDSGINLEKDYPAAYPTVFTLNFSKLHFIVAVPWGEQKCTITMSKNKISCEPTGK